MSTSFKDAVMTPTHMQHVEFTFNGMPTNAESCDSLVDLFFAIGSSRGKDLTELFSKAWQEDATMALRILFYARDVRQGAGERETFRNLIKHVEKINPQSVMKNMNLISEYGRWDDLLVFETAQVKSSAYSHIALALSQGNGLAAKWMPRKGPIANELRKFLNFTPLKYRKTLVTLTNVVETDMCRNTWGEINYNHVPSVASGRYTKAFNKHDPVRYKEWKNGLATGTTKVNAGAVYPHDVIHTSDNGTASVAMAQWKNLKNYLGNDCILPLVDTSSSMAGAYINGKRHGSVSCLDAAVGLGLYIADKQQGPFQNMVLNFNSDSSIHVLSGDFREKLRQLRNLSWGGSTNLESAFLSILTTAKNNNIEPSQMPKTLVVLSDMEFNPIRHNSRETAMQMVEREYQSHGYAMPNIVWWNLNARPGGRGNTPADAHAINCALVSGFSPSIISSVTSGNYITPWMVMMEKITSERYEAVQA